MAAGRHLENGMTL